MARTIFACVLCLALAACGGGTEDPVPGETAPLLAAGSTQLDPVPDPGIAASTNLGRLGVSTVEAVYDLTTPVNTPFAFDVLFRGQGNAGPVRVSLAHAKTGGATPTGGPETLAAAGIVANGPGVGARSPWLDAQGDGFSRISIRGAIDREQVLCVQVADDAIEGTALVRIRPGPESAINHTAATDGDYPGIQEVTTLYSSDAWAFGLPTAALSGDRTSVVCYEGAQNDPVHFQRYEMRLQHEALTGAVTGGGSEESSPDSGNWRDHEIAALYNVLALVHGGDDRVKLRLSFDRGASFAQTESFGQGGAAWRPRLVQIAMALDYTLAVLYWRSNRNGSSDLVLVEGKPSAWDSPPPGEAATPTAFAFDPPVVVHHEGTDVTPTLMGATYSENGDLVIGYAFTRFRSLPDRRWENLTQNRCAIRLWGEAFRDVLVEEDRVVGRDPSVAVLGHGAGMRIFYAYEAEDGVRVRSSADAGRTFSAPLHLGDPSAHMPTVFARADGGSGSTTVDVLYLAYGGQGMEIHLAHVPDWGSTPPEVWRLTTAVMEGSDTPPPGPWPEEPPVPGEPPSPLDGALAPDPGYGWKLTQVAFFGYDAILDGDEIVVVYDEETFDAWAICWGAPSRGGQEIGFGEDAAGAAPFAPADPPPLAPGMTEPVAPPDPEHMHQLKLLRLK